MWFFKGFEIDIFTKFYEARVEIEKLQNYLEFYDVKEDVYQVALAQIKAKNTLQKVEERKILYI